MSFEDANRQEVEGPRPRAVMVAVQLPGVSDAELDSSLAELGRLASTLGIDVIGRVTQRRAGLATGKVLGDGKLKELASWTGGTGVVPKFEKPGAKKKKEEEGDDEPEEGDDVVPQAVEAEQRATVVLVDHDLSPSQQRNLELATGAEVHDRTSVILGIFHRHARTREARMQVEIARLAYLAPRLRAAGGGGDRVRGGIGGRGAGESSLELDRRRIRDRIAELRKEIAAIEGGSHTRRSRRNELPNVALVGYTNAGKSSLMRALTGSEVYVADKLFATLDTTVRVLLPRTEPPILVSDTVGFIKKLPHDLVASFRSTLEEAGECDLLLHVVDASDAAFRDHIEVTRQVLGEIEADRAPAWILLNTIDRVDYETGGALLDEFPDAIALSAKDPTHVAALRDRIVGHFLGSVEDAELFVPWARHALVNTVHAQCEVVSEKHEDDGTRLKVRAAKTVLERLRSELGAAGDGLG
jgi:GTP-binding protein HflX